MARCLEEDADALLVSIRVYVQRFGLAHGAEAIAVAHEVLQEVSVQALDHADRFDVGRRPAPWLLGVALNIIRRMRAEEARRERREQFVGDLLTAQEEDAMAERLTAGDAWDRAGRTEPDDPFREIEASENAEAMLALVTPTERETLRLAIIEGWDHKALAQRLGVSAGAARTRLHRALSRLRAAWFAQGATPPPTEGAPRG